jgi:hypothetical protein
MIQIAITISIHDVDGPALKSKIVGSLENDLQERIFAYNRGPALPYRWIVNLGLPA